MKAELRNEALLYAWEVVDADASTALSKAKAGGVHG